jgi:hypothetical protein
MRTTPVRQHVLLVPGFFGFANLGDFSYFAHVRELLERSWQAKGIPGEIRVVQTLPTAALSRRAARVLEAIDGLPDGVDSVVHLIGHSSGGLDARLVASPDVELPGELAPERLARKIRTVVTLSSPHYGSPLAGFLTSVLGQQFLKVISLLTIYTLRTGRVPIAAVFYLVRLLSLRRLPVADGTLLNQIYRDLLSDFSHDRRLALDAFFVEVGGDQALLPQLTPSGMELFGASTWDRPGVRYGSVVTCVPPPGLRSAWSTGLSPFRQATHMLFTAFYRLTARMPHDRTRALSPSQSDALVRAFGRIPSRPDNDGMVPTLSQVWGDIVHATWGDHLDALGHFYLPTHVPPHFDWLNSGASFTLPDFARLWTTLTTYLLAGTGP